MRRFSTFIKVLSALLSCAIFVTAQTPIKLAEGSYGVPETPMAAAIRWEITKSADGGFLVTSAQSGKPNLVQEFGFTDNWNPSLYSMNITPTDSAQRSLSLICRYLSDSISCDAHHKGLEVKSSLHITGPKIFFSEGIDVIWMMAAVCAQAERTPGKATEVTEISIADDPDDSVLKLEVSESLTVVYVGQESLKTTLGTTQANKFRVGDMTIWTGDSGLILALTVEGSDSGKRIELSSLNDTTRKLITRGPSAK
jgi:hypothetical protein